MKPSIENLSFFEILPRRQRIQFLEVLDLLAVLQKQTAVVHPVCLEEARMHSLGRLVPQPEQEIGIEAAKLEKTDAGLRLVTE
jgi:hypothetical protein